ncbi:MAG: hypothetical protein IPJ98_19630 [Bryobacterales bacterium]|nr:hypothetical protein [Bryobacterales bacterium]
MLLLMPVVVWPQASSNGSFSFVHRIAGSRGDVVRAVAVGPDGSLFVAGVTDSDEFMTTEGAARPARGAAAVAEVFVRKLSADGSEVVYSTLLGPAGFYTQVALGVDGQGFAYIAHTRPVEDKLTANVLEAEGSIVVVKLTPDGTRMAQRVALLPNVSAREGLGLAVDHDGTVYVAAGSGPLEMRKVNAEGTGIESRARAECAQGGTLAVTALARGPGASVYVAGKSTCADFPATAGAYRASAVHPGNGDGFVMRFNEDWTVPAYATLVGGESVDEALGLTVARDGSATVVGMTVNSRNLAPLPATPLRMGEPALEKSYGLVATLSPDGTALQGAALLPATTLTAVTQDGDGNLYVGGTSFYGALLARVSPELNAVHFMVEPPAYDAKVGAVALAGGKLFVGGWSRSQGIPDNNPAGGGDINGFAALLPEEIQTADLVLRVTTRIAAPDLYRDYTTCRYELSNRGEHEAVQVQLVAGIEGNASFRLWHADPPVFNIPSFWTGSAGGTRAAVERLAPGQTVTLELQSNNYIFSGIDCAGRVYAGTADADPSDNAGADMQRLSVVRLTVNGLRGLTFRRDDWPAATEVGTPLNVTPGRKVRIEFQSPQVDRLQRGWRFDKWSDGSTENPRVFSMGESDVAVTAGFVAAAAGAAAGPMPEGGQPNEQQGTGGVIPIHMRPFQLEAGARERVVEVNGSGFARGWEVTWNGEPRPTEYVNPYVLKVTLSEDDVTRPQLGWMAVRDGESGQTVRAAEGFWIHVAVWHNDVVWDESRGRLWVAVAEEPGKSGPAIALIDPATGLAERRQELSAEPQALALTGSGRYLFVASNGKVARMDTEAWTFDQEAALPIRDISGRPTEAYSMLIVPGREDQVVVSLHAPFVSPSYSGTVLVTGGEVAESRLSDREGPGELYGWLDESTAVGGDGDSLYWVKVSGGVRLERKAERVMAHASCVMESGELYCSDGAVRNAWTGARLRQFAAAGAVGVPVGTDAVAFVDFGLQLFPGGGIYGPLVVMRRSSGEFVSANLVTAVSVPGTMGRWGGNGLIFRATQGGPGRRLTTGFYLFQVNVP